MVITNNLTTDITFELDVNKSPLKGMQSRITVRPGFPATVGVEHVLLLVMDLGFQAQKAAGNIAITYAAVDTTYLNNIRDFLAGIY